MGRYNNNKTHGKDTKRRSSSSSSRHSASLSSPELVTAFESLGYKYTVVTPAEYISRVHAAIREESTTEPSVYLSQQLSSKQCSDLKLMGITPVIAGYLYPGVLDSTSAFAYRIVNWSKIIEQKRSQMSHVSKQQKRITKASDKSGRTALRVFIRPGVSVNVTGSEIVVTPQADISWDTAKSQLHISKKDVIDDDSSDISEISSHVSTAGYVISTIGSEDSSVVLATDANMSDDVEMRVVGKSAKITVPGSVSFNTLKLRAYKGGNIVGNMSSATQKINVGTDNVSGTFIDGFICPLMEWADKHVPIPSSVCIEQVA